jgi:hypothetical protein
MLNPPDDPSDGDGAPDEEESPEEKEEESGEDEIASIADSMSNMRIATSRYDLSGDLSGRFPFILYVYAESRHKVSVEMVFGLPKKCFRPRVRTGGMYLNIEVELPNLFFNWWRLILASQDRGRCLISQNDRKVVAYKLVSQDVKENNNNSPASIKQSIKLHFQVNEDFCTDDGPGWEIQVFDNAGTGGELEEENNLFILSIDMQAIKLFAGLVVFHHQRLLQLLPGPPRDVHEVRNAFRGGRRGCTACTTRTCLLMAGLLNAQFACYVRVNFESAFYRRLGKKKSQLPFFFPAHTIFSRPERRHIKWHVVNQYF